MNILDKLRYLDRQSRRKVFAVGALFLAAIAATSLLVVSRCNRVIEANTGRLDSNEQAALAQVREAFFAVQTALVGESPAPTVMEAVRRVQSEKDAGAFKSVVDQSALKFNPDKTEWTGGPRGGGGAAIDTVLVVAAAPAEYKARNVVLIGVGRGGIPVEIAAGSEPAWLGTAATAPD